MTYELINVSTTNTIDSFESEEEGRAAFEAFVSVEPEQEIALVAFDAAGEATEVLASPTVAS